MPELGIVSYKAAISQTLPGRKPGDTDELPAEVGQRKGTIVSITAFTDLDLLRDKVNVVRPEA